MNLKKIIILPAAFLLVHVLYIGCCKCIEGNFHRQITSIAAIEYGDRNFYSQDTVKVIDTLIISMETRYALVAKANSNPFAQFVNGATALSCNCAPYNDLGYTHAIDSITIVSNNAFKNIPAGSDLSDQFLSRYTSYDSVGQSHSSIISVAQLVDSLNLKKNPGDILLFSKSGVPPEKSHRFTYTLFSNGQRFTYTSGRLLLWQ